MENRILKIGGIVFLVIIGLGFLYACIMSSMASRLHYKNEQLAKEQLESGELVLKTDSAE